MRDEVEDQSGLTPGIKVFNSSGDEGVFLDFIDQDGLRYGRFQFGELRSLIPLRIINKRISFLPPKEVIKPSLKDLVQRLTDNPETYYMPGNLIMSEKQKEEMTQLIDQARQMKALFRGDDRHPFFPIERDGERIMPPFVDGFKQYNDTIGRGIYTTADFGYAFSYPEYVNKGFVYIISPETILNTVSEYKPFDENGWQSHIRSSDIPPTDIYAAIGHHKLEITDIQFNPSFSKGNQASSSFDA